VRLSDDSFSQAIGSEAEAVASVIKTGPSYSRLRSLSPNDAVLGANITEESAKKVLDKPPNNSFNLPQVLGIDAAKLQLRNRALGNILREEDPSYQAPSAKSIPDPHMAGRPPSQGFVSPPPVAAAQAPRVFRSRPNPSASDLSWMLRSLPALPEKPIPSHLSEAMCVGRVCWGAAGQLIYPKANRPQHHSPLGYLLTAGMGCASYFCPYDLFYLFMYLICICVFFVRQGTRVVLDRLAVVPPKFEPLIDDMSCLPLVVAQPGSSLPRVMESTAYMPK
jgi:hypothetical protein